MEEKNRIIEQDHNFDSPFDGVCVTKTDGYDRETAAAVRRRTQYTSDGGSRLTVRRYGIGRQNFTVCSFFGKDEKRTAEDMIRRIIDSEETGGGNSL